jgi:hypothetical protein
MVSWEINNKKSLRMNGRISELLLLLKDARGMLKCTLCSAHIKTAETLPAIIWRLFTQLCLDNAKLKIK